MRRKVPKTKEIEERKIKKIKKSEEVMLDKPKKKTAHTMWHVKNTTCLGIENKNVSNKNQN